LPEKIVKNMNTIAQNKKAMTPVVASIILIAVAISVSLVTAGWLGAMASHYTGTASVMVDNAQFSGTAGQPTNSIVLSMKNIGTKAITVEMIKINGNNYSFSPSAGGNVTYVPTETKEMTINNVGWQTAFTYDIAIYGDEGQAMGAYRATSPGS
jgi:FlaG/FlaF family flagellin (archaellin)